MYAENKHKANTREEIEDLTNHPDRENIEYSRTVIDQINRIRVHRHWGQPYVRRAGYHSDFCAWLTGLVDGVLGLWRVHRGPVHERLDCLPPHGLANR